MASVTGLFRERECAVVRSFRRVFAIVPLNGGFCIINKQFYITSAEAKVGEKAIEDADAARLAHRLGMISVNPEPVETREQSILNLAHLTGMNLLWAAKCLEENGWEYETAHSDLKKLAGKVPAEAFLVC